MSDSVETKKASGPVRRQPDSREQGWEKYFPEVAKNRQEFERAAEEAEKKRIFEDLKAREKQWLQSQKEGCPPTVEHVKAVIATYAGLYPEEDAGHVMAQIQKESGDINQSSFNFRVDVVNKSDGGSAGMTQIHPSGAAYRIAQAAGMDDYPLDRKEQSVYLKKNWVSAIRLMFAFRQYARKHVLGIGRIRDRAERDKFMLAAYNMGETQLNQLIRLFKANSGRYPQSWQEFVTKVNVNSVTKTYVAKVTTRARSYGYKG